MYWYLYLYLYIYICISYILLYIYIYIYYIKIKQFKSVIPEFDRHIHSIFHRQGTCASAAAPGQGGSKKFGAGFTRFSWPSNLIYQPKNEYTYIYIYTYNHIYIIYMYICSKKVDMCLNQTWNWLIKWSNHMFKGNVTPGGWWSWGGWHIV